MTGHSDFADVAPAYLWRCVRARVLPLVQLVPALHQLDDHGVAEVDQLEARDVGAAVHEALQVDVLETLQGKRVGGANTKRGRSRFPVSKQRHKPSSTGGVDDFDRSASAEAPSLANVDGGRREFDVIWVDARNKSVASDSDS